MTQIPADIVAVNDYVPYAKTSMSPQAWAYFHGGVGDELLLRRNIQAAQNYQIWPRVLTDMSAAHTRFSLSSGLSGIAQEYAFPIFLAPVAYQRMAHPDGELASALAAAAMQTPFIISMQASVDLATLAQQAPGPQWLQWYWQVDQEGSQRLLDQAVALGIEAIVLTVDAPVNGVRNTEQRAQFVLPNGIEAVNLRGIQRAAIPTAQAGQSPLFGSGLLAQSPRWTEVAHFIAQCPLPVYIKGILHPADARQAVNLGAAGVIVSNHGGRVLDAAPSPLQALAAVVQAVAGQVPVFVDGGIRRGTDIFIALALGAQAVLIGRPYIYALAVAGAAGVAHVLHLLRTELEVTMALAGCATLADIKTAEITELPPHQLGTWA